MCGGCAGVLRRAAPVATCRCACYRGTMQITQDRADLVSLIRAIVREELDRRGPTPPPVPRPSRVRAWLASLPIDGAERYAREWHPAFLASTHGDPAMSVGALGKALAAERGLVFAGRVLDRRADRCGVLVWKLRAVAGE